MTLDAFCNGRAVILWKHWSIFRMGSAQMLDMIMPKCPSPLSKAWLPPPFTEEFGMKHSRDETWGKGLLDTHEGKESVILGIHCNSTKFPPLWREKLERFNAFPRQRVNVRTVKKVG